MTLLVLPLTSSAPSGFFFWGIIELPVANSSGKFIKSNCWFDQRIISSAILDKCIQINERTNKNSTANIEHEATTSKISEDQLFYCNQRGLNQEEAVSLIVNGFCKEVLQQLPMEFAVEAQKLVSISLEGSVG